MSLELTRRDALVALAAGGFGIGGPALVVSEWPRDGPANGDLSERDVSTLVSLADVLYPSAVTGKGGFVRAYVGGLPAERRAEMARGVDRLDEGARRYAGSDFRDLSSARRETVLRRMGLDTVRSDPDGLPPARVRYYLINSLLYALYTTPTGSELLGIENPAGHPGGYETMTRPPEDDGD